MTAKKKPGARLSPSFVETVTEPRSYGDGRGGLGLRLVVKERAKGGVSKSWKQRVPIKDAKAVNLGLGTCPPVGLRDAREKAKDNAILGAQGIDPRYANKGIPTFGDAAKEWFDGNYKNQSDSRKKTVWGTIENHALPELENEPVDEITSEDIGKVLDPIWVSNPLQHVIFLVF